MHIFPEGRINLELDETLLLPMKPGRSNRDSFSVANIDVELSRCWKNSFRDRESSNYHPNLLPQHATPHGEP